MPESLQETEVEIHSSKKCSEMYTKLNRGIFKKGIDESLICAGSTSMSLTDTCQVRQREGESFHFSSVK